MSKTSSSHVKPTGADTVLLVAPYLLLAGLWAYVLAVYPGLPAEIPTHFNALGVSDATGPRTAIWGSPIGATIFVALLSLLIRFPRAFNYPVKVTPRNAAALKGLAIRMLRSLQSSLVLIGYIAATTMAFGGLGIITLPLVLALVFLPLGYFLMQMYQQRPA